VTNVGTGLVASCDEYVYVGRCGDGLVNGTEECDDGNGTNNDGCSTTCIDESATGVCGTASNIDHYSTT
jgi:cysteine-rich repeat protein